MKFTRTSFKNFALIVIMFAYFPSHALNTRVTEQQADSSIQELYHKLNHMPSSSMAERIDWISKQFLGKPYVLGSLGEGQKGRYDQFPQYRIDAFDCDTYVNTVVSLALANSTHSFQQCIKYMRYINGKVSYIRRTHFTGLDWNQYHQQRGLFKDITFSIQDKKNHSVAHYALATIDKPNWYAYKTHNNIRLQHENKITQKQRLVELKAKGTQLKITTEKVPYLPFSALFLSNGKPNLYLLAQIPHGAIIEIVRPNWALQNKIGTALNISHLGFVISKQKQLYFREASTEYGKVIDIPLIKYLQKIRQSPTIKGINVQILLPQRASLKECTMQVSI